MTISMADLLGLSPDSLDFVETNDFGDHIKVTRYPYRVASIMDQIIVLPRELMLSVEVSLRNAVIGDRPGANHETYCIENTRGQMIYIKFSDRSAVIGRSIIAMS